MVSSQARDPQIIQATNQPPCAPIPTKSYLALTPVMSSQAKSLQTDPVHKCRNLANCGQFTSTTILQTAISSQVPPSCKLLRFERTKSCKLLAIHKYQNLANCCQVTSTAILQTALVRKYQNLENWFTSSQVPTSCKQSSIHKCQHLVNRLSLHKCQNLANCCQFTSAKFVQTTYY